MMNKKTWPYLIAVALFAIASLIYFYPVLKGQKIFQSDIQQFIGMSKEIKDFRLKENAEPYWTNSAFSGMPTFQLSTYYPYDFIRAVDKVLRMLPHPADYLMLYFLGFFIMLSVLKVDWKLALFGSIGFGLSTYLVIILGVGHNAKAHAIAYIPLVFASAFLLLQKKWLWGFLLAFFAIALEIYASHIQMTYYMVFALFFLFGAKLLEVRKDKSERRAFFKGLMFFSIAFFLGIGVNANKIIATKSYAANSTRSASELTIDSSGKQKEASKGLTKSYITEYSYGMAETFNLFVPRFMGGAQRENYGKESETYQFLAPKIGAAQASSFAAQVPSYWGKQPIVAAPAYIGAVFVFLFLLGLFLIKGWMRWFVVSTFLCSILLSWGKNFSLLTDFFIDYIPFYDKFRAVSSIQILAEIVIPLFAILGLHKFLTLEEENTQLKKRAIYYAAGISVSFCLFFMLFGTNIFDFKAASDAYYNQMLNGLSDYFVLDRKQAFRSDLTRSLLFVVAAFAVLFGFIHKKIQWQTSVVIVGVLLVLDVFGVAKRYVNEDNFVSAQKVEKPFKPSEIDKEILKDKSYYRVANFSGNFMNDGATSYFHHSIGGYHAAKLRRYQELVEFHIQKNNTEVLNMLNTKYLIVSGEKGQQLIQNPEANGNAWFVSDLIKVTSANDEILALNNINTKTQAVINTETYPLLEIQGDIEVDSLARVKLFHMQSNELMYQVQTSKSQWLVFSEIFYQPGWQAYLNGKKVPHYNVNYVLRAMPIQAGEHEIIFKFEPKEIEKGNRLVLLSFGLFFVICLLFLFKKRLGKLQDWL